MPTVMLEEQGGTLCMPLPPVLSRSLSLKAGAALEVDFEEGRLVAAPPGERVRSNPYRYTLAELLADGDYSQPLSEADRQWVDFPPLDTEWS